MMLRLFFLLFLCLNFYVSVGQTPQFKQLTVDDGLLSNHINCFLRDKQGFLWIGSPAGLMRYDGKAFKHYTVHASINRGLIGNGINSLFLGPKDEIWVFTSQGICRYNPITDSFTADLSTYQLKHGWPLGDILKISPYNEGAFLILYKTGDLYTYKEASNKLVKYTKHAGRITDFSVANGELAALIYEDGSVDQVALEKLSLQFRKSLSKGASRQDYSIFMDAQADYWIYSKHNPQGCYWFPKDAEQPIHLMQGGVFSLANNFISNIVQDSSAAIWIATDHGGINIFDKSQRKLKTIKHEPFNSRSLPYNSTTALYADYNGIIWVGTYKGGVSYYHPQILLFPVFESQLADPKSLPYADVNRFVEDRLGNLWIGTNGGGLLYYNTKDGSYKQFKHQASNPQSISSDVIVSLHVDADNILWVGTYQGGLNRFDGVNFKHYQPNPQDKHAITDHSVWEIYESNPQELYIGTLGGGLLRFNKQTEVFQRVQQIQSPYISVIKPDGKGNLWIGTATGIEILASNGEVSRIQATRKSTLALSNELIYDILFDKQGRAWVGTQDGLNILDGKKTTILRKEDGLTDNSIFTLLADKKGHIWMSSSNGLMELSPEQQPFHIRSYDRSHGLQGRAFNENAALLLRDGRLLFGGPNGFNSIDPSNIQPKIEQSPVKIGDFYLSNKLITVDDGTEILKENILETKSLTLPYDQNTLAFTLSIFDYLHQNIHSLQYMLTGYSEDWMSIDPMNPQLSFTNLSPGSYTLKVRYMNERQQWVREDVLLKIMIRPPFWLSLGAYILYACLLILGVIIFRRVIILRERSKNQLLSIHEQAQRAQELDALKTKFFTNVSHEFRTPISLMLTPLADLLQQERNQPIVGELELIYRNANRLLDLVNQLLDLRKIEQQSLRIHRSYGDLTAHIRELANSFRNLAELKRIDFQIQLPAESILASFDQEKVDRVLFNLLSNAFKFTRVEGQIQLLVSLPEAGILQIQVVDNGIGIPAADLAHIFDRYFQSNHGLEELNNQGSGIGLSIVQEYVKLMDGAIDVAASIDQGSTFTLRLPLLMDMQQPQANEEGSAVPKNKSSQMKLLILEDQLDFQRYLKEQLQQDYWVAVASQAEEAYELLQKTEFDLILSDINLPGASGIDFCKRLKMDKRHKHIPVIMLTAVVDDRIALEALQAGASDYIIKPFKLPLLHSKIQSVLRQKDSLAQKYKRQVEVHSPAVDIHSADELFMLKLVQHIEQNLGDANFSVESLAADMHMTRVGLYKKILSLTGYSPTVYIRNIRLNKALFLLENSGKNVTEIAYEVGFSNAKQFAKYFKSLFGNPPSQYLK